MELSSDGSSFNYMKDTNDKYQNKMEFPFSERMFKNWTPDSFALNEMSMILPVENHISEQLSNFEGENISVPALEYHDHETVVKKEVHSCTPQTIKLDEGNVPALECLEIAGSKTAQESDYREHDNELEDDDDECEDPGFELIRVIGSGKYGQVTEVRDLSTYQKIALKENKRKEDKDGAIREAELHRSLSHKNIVQFIDCYEDDTKISILMELIPGGSLHSLLIREGRGFSEQVTSHYMAQVVDVFCYLHANGIVHLDLKGGNLLINEYSAKCYLCDFGSARRVSDGPLYENLGTPNYMAPEVIKASKENSYDGKRADGWSIGCLAIEMLIGEPPYFQMDQATIIFQVGNNTLNPKIPENISKKCKHFIESCVKRDPLERATIEELKEQDFIQSTPRVKRGEQPVESCDKPIQHNPCVDERENYSSNIETAYPFEQPYEENSDSIDINYKPNYCFSNEAKSFITQRRKEIPETNEENSTHDKASDILEETEHSFNSADFALTNHGLFKEFHTSSSKTAPSLYELNDSFCSSRDTQREEIDWDSMSTEFDAMEI